MKRADDKTLLLRLSYYAPSYSARRRLKMRRNRRFFSRGQVYKQKIKNKRR